jgi:hypothetical protein
MFSLVMLLPQVLAASVTVDGLPLKNAPPPFARPAAEADDHAVVCMLFREVVDIRAIKVWRPQLGPRPALSVRRLRISKPSDNAPYLQLVSTGESFSSAKKVVFQAASPFDEAHYGCFRNVEPASSAIAFALLATSTVDDERALLLCFSSCLEFFAVSTSQIPFARALCPSSRRRLLHADGVFGGTARRVVEGFLCFDLLCRVEIVRVLGDDMAELRADAVGGLAAGIAALTFARRRGERGPLAHVLPVSSMLGSSTTWMRSSGARLFWPLSHEVHASFVLFFA